MSWEAPHSVEGSPAGVACNPRDARVIHSPTDDQPPPRQEGEAVVSPFLRQLRDGAGVGGRAREQLNARDHYVIDADADADAADHHLP